VNQKNYAIFATSLVFRFHLPILTIFFHRCNQKWSAHVSGVKSTTSSPRLSCCTAWSVH